MYAIPILAQRQKPERGFTERRFCLTSAGAGEGERDFAATGSASATGSAFFSPDPPDWLAPKATAAAASRPSSATPLPPLSRPALVGPCGPSSWPWPRGG